MNTLSPNLKLWLHICQSRATKRNREWSLTEEEFVTLCNSPCIYCGHPPELRRLGLTTYPISGLDRINNDLGYTHENTAPCCTLCNTVKGPWTVTDLTPTSMRIEDMGYYITKEAFASIGEQILELCLHAAINNTSVEIPDLRGDAHKTRYTVRGVTQHAEGSPNVPVQYRYLHRCIRTTIKMGKVVVSLKPGVEYRAVLAQMGAALPSTDPPIQVDFPTLQFEDFIARLRNTSDSFQCRIGLGQDASIAQLEQLGTALGWDMEIEEVGKINESDRLLLVTANQSGA